MKAGILNDTDQIWKEMTSGRFIRILIDGADSFNPFWVYCDAQGEPEMDDDYSLTYAIMDFYKWPKFEYVSAVPKVKTYTESDQARATNPSVLLAEEI
jgi:hypothetical protein